MDTITTGGTCRDGQVFTVASINPGTCKSCAIVAIPRKGMGHSCPAFHPLPCLSVTTQTGMQTPSECTPLPGPKKKQAEALFQCIKWLAESFGDERVGFLTLTCGDYDAAGRFVKIEDRAEASRRFNSLLTGILRDRYRCGVTVMERHKDGGIHFHLVCVTSGNIRRGFNWESYDRLQGEVKRRERKGWTAQQVGASASLREEWEFWRDRAAAYGFGRCQMLPMRKNGEAMGRYVGKYIGKAWDNRRPEDQGARLVRYFGKWATVEWEARVMKTKAQSGDTDRPRFTPPFTANHARMTPKARLWRECARQVAARVAFDGITITPDTVKNFAGPRWAWHWTKKFNATEFIWTRRHAGIEIDFEAWQNEVRGEWQAGQPFGMNITDKVRGAAFWSWQRESMMDLIRCRRANDAAKWQAEGIAEVAAMG